MVTIQAALGKTSFHCLNGLFNAESIFMRRERPQEARHAHSGEPQSSMPQFRNCA
jgi:hypothetical protein